MWTLTHSRNMYLKDRLIVWSTFLVFSKAFLFLSFHKVLNKHKGVALRGFFFFFPTNDLCQLRRTSLIEEDITHWTPNRAKTNHHSMPALEQWRIRSAISSFTQITSTRQSPLLLSWFKDKILLHEASKEKETNLHQNLRFPHNAYWKLLHIAICYGGIQGFNCKNAALWIPPNHDVLYIFLINCPSNLLKKASTSPNSQPCPPPSLLWRNKASLVVAMEKQAQEHLFQWIIAAPHVLPKCHPLTISHPKPNPFNKLLPLTPNSFHNPTLYLSLDVLERQSPSSSLYFP